MGGADMLVSSWSENVKTVPANYILPPERRPQVFLQRYSSLAKAEASSEGRADQLDQMLKAGHEFGMFQVINHGITEEMQEARNMGLDFFKMTVDEKEALYSAEVKKWRQASHERPKLQF